MARIPLSVLTYFPPISLLAPWAGAPVVYLEAQEHYQKGSYRNRCHLAGPNGLLRLSIPLRKGKNQQTPIREVRIAYDEPWHHQHWQSIRTAYGNAPFWEYYSPPFEAILQDPPERLWDLNWRLLQAVLKALRWSPNIQLTERYGKLELPVEQLELPVEQLELPVEQLELPVGLLDLRPLAGAKQPLPYKLPPYPQVFTEKHGFLPNLSILDLLFCQGPAAALYLVDLNQP